LADKLHDEELRANAKGIVASCEVRYASKIYQHSEHVEFESPHLFMADKLHDEELLKIPNEKIF